MRDAVTLSKYCFKDLIRRKYNYILVIIYVALLFLSINNKSPNYLFFTYNEEYKLSAYILIMYISINIGLINKDVFKPLLKKWWVEPFANILVISKVIIVINILFFGASLYVYFNEGISLEYYLNGLIGNTLIFNLGLILFMIIGLIISKYSKKVFGYIISIILIYVLNQNYFQNSTTNLPDFNEYTFKELMSHFYSLPAYKMNINGKLSALINYDDFFFYHCLFFIIVIIATGIIYFALNNDYNKKKIILTISIFGAILIYFNMGLQYDTYSKKYSNKSSKFIVQEQGLKVNKYIMDLELGDKINNSCTISGIIEREQEIVIFALDKGLKVEEVIINNKKVNFENKDNIVKVNVEGITGEVDFKIEYSGEINYRDNYDMVQYFSRDEDSFLTDNIAWYPMVKGENEKEYEIRVKTQNDIFMSIEEVSNSDNYSTFKGKTNGLLLVSGFLKTYGNESTISYEGWNDLSANEVKEFYNLDFRKDMTNNYIESCRDSIKNLDKILNNPLDEMYIENIRINPNYVNELKREREEMEEELKYYIKDLETLNLYGGNGKNIIAPIYFYKIQSRNQMEKYCYGDYHVIDGAVMIIEE
ncbi:MAG: hypothetical protein ACRC7N_03105 [Clostridium sp.]